MNSGHVVHQHQSFPQKAQGCQSQERTPSHQHLANQIPGEGTSSHTNLHQTGSFTGNSGQTRKNTGKKDQVVQSNSGNKKSQKHEVAGGGRNKTKNIEVSAFSVKHNQQSATCKVCSAELMKHELHFYPCNCKYKICHECFWNQVNNRNGKCPNCDLLYEVNRARESINKSLQKLRSSSPADKLTTANKIQRASVLENTRRQSGQGTSLHDFASIVKDSKLSNQKKSAK